ncbi:hypothetical protein [Actinoplanes sp. NPDC089786]|uniref:hypothetical protein n=1 Tax=Actinoplanes sp. NPDC089786 TaxID=3155185 RepID=UPI00341A339C
MRSRLLTLGVVVATLAVTGCNAKDDARVVLPPIEVVEPPAASGGGACILWDYAFIEEMIGVRFTVAAGSQVDNTATCVVQTEEGPEPSLLLTVSDSSATAELFNDDLIPDKATKLKGLGVAAYKQEIKASKTAGPSYEIGWLSEGHQLQSLRFTFTKAAKPAAVADMGAKLLAMAKTMTSTTGTDPKKKTDAKKS